MAYPEFLLSLKQLPMEENIKREVYAKFVTAPNMQSNLEMERGFLWQRGNRI